MVQAHKGKHFNIKRGKSELIDVPEFTDKIEMHLDDDLKQLFKNTWSSESISGTNINQRMLEMNQIIKQIEGKKSA